MFDSCNSCNCCINSGTQLLDFLSFSLLYIPMDFFCHRCTRQHAVPISEKSQLLLARDWWFNYRLAIQDRKHKNSFLTVYFTICISLAASLALTSPNSTPNGHIGSTFVEGSCSNRGNHACHEPRALPLRCNRGQVCVIWKILGKSYSLIWFFHVLGL